MVISGNSLEYGLLELWLMGVCSAAWWPFPQNPRMTDLNDLDKKRTYFQEQAAKLGLH